MRRPPHKSFALPDPGRIPRPEGAGQRPSPVRGGGLERRNLLRILGCTFLAPTSALRSLLDPLRAVPSVIADLTLLQLIGWQKPSLRSGRWNDAELLREATESLDEMSHAARADGVNVWARSGHRTLSQQRYRWNSKFRGRESVRTPDGWRGRLDRDLSTEEKVRRILGYTAFPGTSRHHWGTDVDMAQSYSDHCADYLMEHPVGGEAEGGESAPGEEAEGVEAGEGRAEEVPADVPDNCLLSQRWLFTHAAGYGWCRVYDATGGFSPSLALELTLAVPALARTWPR